MFAGFLLPLYASVHRILCADISAQLLYDICNSSLCAINYLRRSLRMTSLCLACAVGRPHFHYSKGSFSFCSIDYSLLLNHSPSEWFSLYKKAISFSADGFGRSVIIGLGKIQSYQWFCMQQARGSYPNFFSKRLVSCDKRFSRMM